MITIKEIQIKEHYAAISKLLLGLHNSEKELFSKGADWKDIEKPYMRHVIQMQEENEGTCLVAMSNDEMVGFIFGYSYEQEDDRTETYTGRELYVSDGYVDPAYRRMGIYKQLNEALEAKYIKEGVRRIIRFTLNTNERMQHFLAQNNYTVVRLQYEKWLTPDGKAIDKLD
jgi:ribosomal protein S18 acetylase RimI-like enzyme